jgi:hypothetical protein
VNKRQKKKQIKNRNKKLVEEYPFLLPRNVWTDKLHKDYNYEYTWYDDIDKGWQIGFGKLLLEDLKQALVETNYLYDFRFMQIKEKYGSLRLYCNGIPQEVHDVLRKYEFISEYVCIQCGSPNAYVVNDYGWYLPLCKDCWDKNNKIREEKGYKTISYEETLNMSYEEIEETVSFDIPNSYKVECYSKGETTTIEYDIRDTKQKIINAYKKRMQNKEKKEKYVIIT